MSIPSGQRPVFRFAPSPNGRLHLGHALSACLNFEAAQQSGGRFLLRIEDIDLTRCTPELERGIHEDLAWLGLDWEHPVRRQSEHFDDYRVALERLVEEGLVYPAFMTRGEVKARVAEHEKSGKVWPRDPDGAPLYPPDDRERSQTERDALIASGKRHAFRLDMQKARARLTAPLTFLEAGDGPTGTITADPGRWGDVILSRSDAPSSYHLSVVVDDALQGVTHVVRGLDLYAATDLHRLLQHLLDLPEPVYRHHRLVLGADGRKLSKSEGSTALGALREKGLTPSAIRAIIGL